jgi:hypothetical protein
VSTVTTAAGVVTAETPMTRRVRAYFAPVNRTAGLPTIFDAAQLGRFPLSTPPAPWIDLGWISSFARKSGTKVDPLRAGAPAVAVGQARSVLEATVSLEFEAWGALQITLASGSQRTNLLSTLSGATPNGSGGVAAAAVPLISGSGVASTATNLYVGPAAAAGFTPGALVAVDVDYTGQLGYVGAGVSGAYVQYAASVGGDLNYVRRVTLNVAVVVAVNGGTLVLGNSLLAGAPATGMQVSQLVGFCDREGASFFQEWSALFVMDGEQGDRMLFHYPRLQSAQGSAETTETVASPLDRKMLAGAFRALPVKDANDGETVLCFRSYLPATLRTI